MNTAAPRGQRSEFSHHRQRAVFANRAFGVLGVAALPLGILGPLAPAWWEGQWWVVVAILVFALAYGAFGLRRREPSQTYVENVTIRLVVGDLFRQDASAVVGFTTTFDTLVPDVISPTSVQAALLNSAYAGSVARLDEDLTRALSELDLETTSIEKAGKTVSYPMGTVVTLRPPGSVNYYCAAYTAMDTHNMASGTIEAVLDSLNNCWDAADAVGNGEPVCVPLIGQGQSRIPELTPEISIRLTAFSFLIRAKRRRPASELRIVIHPSDRNKINFAEFQAFLSSLAAS